MKFTRAVTLHEEGSLMKKIGTRLWRVDKTFTWWVDYNTKVERAIVPTGFETDLGSVPRFLWMIFEPSEYIAYILHDHLYNEKALLLEDGTLGEIDRESADHILHKALLLEGCSERKAKWIFIGVRLGGWIRWNKS